MTGVPRVYVDFHNADPRGRVRLTCDGTKADLARQGITLTEGLVLRLYDDGDMDEAGRPGELSVLGSVTRAEDSGDWVALIDWGDVRFQPDPGEMPNGVVRPPSESPIRS
jgi:hypothetical protein